MYTASIYAFLYRPLHAYRLSITLISMTYYLIKHTCVYVCMYVYVYICLCVYTEVHAGHWLQKESPELFRRELKDFINGK